MSTIFIHRFDVVQPSSLEEALKILAEEGESVTPMAGGTDVMILIRDGVIKVKKILDLWPLRSQLSYIKREDGYVKIGALTTVTELEKSWLVNDKRYAGFRDVIIGFATPYLRSLATVGGNIGTGHPLSDIGVLLLTLDAEVVLLSTDGERIVPLKEFYLGKRKINRKPNELITEVRFKEAPGNSSTAFIKFDRRRGHSMGYVLVAAYLALKGNVIEDVKIAFDSIGRPYPERAVKTESFLKGKEFSLENIRKAYNEVLPTEMSRISDYRASAEYRLDLSKVLMKRALLRAKERIESR